MIKFFKDDLEMEAWRKNTEEKWFSYGKVDVYCNSHEFPCAVDDGNYHRQPASSFIGGKNKKDIITFTPISIEALRKCNGGVLYKYFEK